MSEPITNLCIVSDIYRCPPKYELVSVNIYLLTFSVVMMAGICNSVGGSVFLTCHGAGGEYPNIHGCQGLLIGIRKQVDVVPSDSHLNAASFNPHPPSSVHLPDSRDSLGTVLSTVSSMQ